MYYITKKLNFFAKSSSFFAKKCRGEKTMRHIRRENICKYINFLKSEYNLQLTIHPYDLDVAFCFDCFFNYTIHALPYCLYIKTDNTAYKHCINQHKKIIDKCKEGSFCGSCHAGIFEFIYPIKFRKNVVGFISVSGYKSDKFQSYLKKLSSNYDYNYSELDNVYKSLSDNKPDKTFVDTLLFPLCDMLELHLHDTYNTRLHEHDWLINLEYYLTLNHTENISLEQICQKFHCSPSHISHAFKKTKGMTIKTYINKLRIEDAKYILQNSSLSIEEIAFSLGFSSINYFSKVFKDITGVSPIAFKKNVKLTGLSPVLY